MANRRFTRAPARRSTSWEGGVVNVTATTGAGFTDTIITEAILENVPNPTIVRIRGSLLLRVTAIAAAPSVSLITMGIKLTSGSALAAGIGAIELPSDEVGSDWIWWSSRAFNADTALAAVNGDDGEALATRVEVDSKAMRKVQPNQVLIFVAQNSALTSTQSIRISGLVRVLLKR